MSDYIKYYKKLSDLVYECEVKTRNDDDLSKCSTKVAVSKTSKYALARHMQRHHNDIYCAVTSQKTAKKQKEEEILQKQRDVMEEFASKTKDKVSAINPTQKAKFDVAFMKLIYYLDYEPFSCGERRGMVQFCQSLCPGYKPPTRQTVSQSLLPVAINDMQMNIKRQLRDAGKFAIALDMWTDKRMRSYLGTIITFIDKKREAHSNLLACEPFTGRHTAERIYATYCDVLQRWDLQLHDVIRIITDNASNMLKAFDLPGFEGFVGNVASTATPERLLEDDDEDDSDDDENVGQDSGATPVLTTLENYIPVKKLLLTCPVHTLQLVIQDSFKTEQDHQQLLSKTAKLVNAIRRSTINTELLGGARPVVSCPTRWGSQLRMIDSVLSLLKKYPKMMDELVIKDDCRLSAYDVNMLQSLSNYLSPFNDLSEKLQKEYGNLGMVLPSISDIVNQLPKDDAFAQTLCINLKKRFEKYYKDSDVMLASVLDPRFKMSWMINDPVATPFIDDVKQLLINECNKRVPPPTQSAPLQQATAAAESHSAPAIAEPPATISKKNWKK